MNLVLRVFRINLSLPVKLPQIVFLVGALLWAGMGARAATNELPVGVARVDITPTHPVRLMGYASRRTESTNAHSPIHARALAIGAGREVAVLITADNCILPAAITEEIRTRLRTAAGVLPERIAVSVNHTHNAPSLVGAAPNLFVEDLPPDQAQRIADYTRFFTDRLVQVALAALSNRQPAQVAWGQGRAGFAANRRTPGGPVDHDVPLMRITGPDGKPRGFLLNYACHCTTLGDFNQTHPDWTGVCARELEAQFPGTVALLAVGCGADANPDPRGSVALVETHGRELAREAQKIQGQTLTTIGVAPVCRLETLQLPYQPHFTRAQWAARSTNSGIVGYHARKWLARVDRGEAPSPTLSYPVQTWVFGDALAMVFLGGEVVVDYSLRLKQELDPRRLWVNAYVNDVPCYIPSRRILREGGYEAESSLWYYDRPQQLSPDVEDLIVGAVRSQLPPSFLADRRQLEHPGPTDPEASVERLRTRPGFQVELVAAEPAVQSPVALDFGPDGSLWVAEMLDYPEGIDGKGKIGGRVKRLVDRDGDGRFEHAEVWAEDLPFPTGVMALDDGVLVGAAPDIVWITPVDGGGGTGPRKTRRTVLFTGFATHNFQARVNGFRWGYDGWIYGSGGLFGGKIHGTQLHQDWDCSGRDFRFRPETGEFESLAGVSQQGRTRDDFGNWFGNDNSTLLWQFPLADGYAKLNPWVDPVSPRASLARGPEADRIYPRSRTLARFNDFSAANRLTSACGPEIYRDAALGEDYYGNALVCEPVHNLVRRAQLRPEGPLFGAWRAPEERRTEFLASTDNWFRPVEVRTGPEGALWVVDFYRFVVEHPRWIPAERMKELDARAGAARGRIYRVAPEGAPPVKLPNVRSATVAELAAHLASGNGTRRDLADREAHRRMRAMSEIAAGNFVKDLELGLTAVPPAARVQWEWLRRREMARFPETQPAPLSLADADARVRRALLPLWEHPRFAAPPGPEALQALVDDSDPGVRFQLALTVGRLPGSEAAVGVLPRLAQRGVTNVWQRAAVVAAAGTISEADLLELVRWTRAAGVPEFTAGVLRSVVGRKNAALGLKATEILFPGGGVPAGAFEAEAFRWYAMLAGAPKLVEQMDQAAEADSGWRRWAGTLRDQSRKVVLDPAAATETRTAAALVLGQSREPAAVGEWVALLEEPLPPASRGPLLAALRRSERPEVVPALLAGWNRLGPAARAERVDLLMARTGSQGALLEALERGVLNAAELSTAQRQALLKQEDPSLRARAGRVLPAANADRTAVVAGYASVDPGSVAADRGLAVFEMNCAACHRMRGIGYPVGPDLVTFRSKSVADFAQAIFDPNSALEPRYAAQVVELKEGRSVTGIVEGETSVGFTLRQSGGLSEQVLRADVVRLAPAALSLMPEGLEQAISREEFASLIRWLQSAPGPFGGTGVAEGLAAQRQLTELGVSRVRAAVSSEPVLPYPSWLSPLPLRYCRQTDGKSAFRWEARALPDAGGGPLRFRFAAGTGLVSQPGGGFRLRVGSEAEVTLEAVVDDAVWASADGRVRVRYIVREAHAEDSCGVLELAVDSPALARQEWVSFVLVGAPAASQRWFGLYEVPGTWE